MKRIIYTFVLLTFAICINGQVKFAFGGGIDNVSTKSSVERNISKLLTEINNAQRANRTLNLYGINIFIFADFPYKCNVTVINSYNKISRLIGEHSEKNINYGNV